MSFQCIQKTKMKVNAHLLWINQLNKWHPAKKQRYGKWFAINFCIYSLNPSNTESVNNDPCIL